MLRMSAIKTDQIVSFLLQTFEHEESSVSVRAIICIGLSKLMLNNAISDERVLIILMMLLKLSYTGF
jgi:condensin complex subunit 3